jgi:hypothetical protein
MFGAIKVKVLFRIFEGYWLVIFLQHFCLLGKAGIKNEHRIISFSSLLWENSCKTEITSSLKLWQNSLVNPFGSRVFFV